MMATSNDNVIGNEACAWTHKAAPAISHTIAQAKTCERVIALEGIGLSARCSRSKPTSQASFKNIPPTYRKLPPAQTNASRASSPPPASSHAAMQFDQTV